jgi:hypothetical protein
MPPPLPDDVRDHLFRVAVEHAVDPPWQSWTDAVSTEDRSDVPLLVGPLEKRDEAFHRATAEPGVHMFGATRSLLLGQLEQARLWSTLCALGCTDHAHAASFRAMIGELERARVTMACGDKVDAYVTRNEEQDCSVPNLKVWYRVCIVERDPTMMCEMCEIFAFHFAQYNTEEAYNEVQPDDAPDGSMQCIACCSPFGNIWRAKANGAWSYWNEK